MKLLAYVAFFSSKFRIVGVVMMNETAVIRRGIANASFANSCWCCEKPQ